MSELTDAGPTDNLAEWHGLQIYDSQGLKYNTQKVWRAWPKHDWGAWLCRVFSHTIYVDFDLTDPTPVSVNELRNRVEAFYGELEQMQKAKTHLEIIELLL